MCPYLWPCSPDPRDMAQIWDRNVRLIPRTARQSQIWPAANRQQQKCKSCEVLTASFPNPVRSQHPGIQTGLGVNWSHQALEDALSLVVPRKQWVHKSKKPNTNPHKPVLTKLVLLFKTGIITAARTGFSWTLNQQVSGDRQPWWPRSHLGLCQGHAGWDTGNWMWQLLTIQAGTDILFLIGSRD